MTPELLDERMRLISRPWTLKVELTRGCNLKCRFCPIHVLPEYSADKQYLLPKDALGIALSYSALNPSGRIELTMRGEPTLNPQVVECVAALREGLPKTQISMFSNGVRFLKEPALIKALLDAGVNILNIDCYNGTYSRFNDLIRSCHPMEDLRDFRSFSAYRRYPDGHRLRVISLVPDIADPAGLVSVRQIHNNAGNADLSYLGVQPLTEPLKRGCARPFREYVVTWDAKVVVCCHDWLEEGVIGDMRENTAREIWYGDAHLAYLRALYAKDRSNPPCFKCDYQGGYRLGLLTNPGEPA